MTHIDLTPLRLAVRNLEEGIPEAEMLAHISTARHGVILRFGYGFELCIKMIKRVLEVQFAEQVDTMPFRDILRSAFEHGLITDPVLWFGFLDDRNKMAHTYDENVAAIVFESAKRFLPEAEFLLSRLERTNP
jgi:nucleotidyltransferase substrate binding protein (TIGR01987 family)